MELLKEIFDSMSARVKTPFWGYAFFTNIYLNWKTYYYILFTDENYGKKFMWFDDHTNIFTLFLIPLGVGLTLAVVSPWLRAQLELLVVGAKKLSTNTLLDSEAATIQKRLEIQEKQAIFERTQAQIAKDRADTAKDIQREQDSLRLQKASAQEEERRRSSEKNVARWEGYSREEAQSGEIDRSYKSAVDEEQPVDLNKVAKEISEDNNSIALPSSSGAKFTPGDMARLMPREQVMLFRSMADIEKGDQSEKAKYIGMTNRDILLVSDLYDKGLVTFHSLGGKRLDTEEWLNESNSKYELTKLGNQVLRELRFMWNKG